MRQTDAAASRPSTARGSPASRRAIWLTVSVSAVVAVAWWLHIRPAGAPRDHGRVIVVDGASQSTPSAPLQAVAQTSTAAAPRPAGSPLAISSLSQALSVRFPVLRDATIACDRTCVMSASTSTAQDARYDPSQLPYMGRLEQFLMERGYAPIDNLMIEEEGGDRSVLRMSFAPARQP